jgi:nickel-dependent lactate racemase
MKLNYGKKEIQISIQDKNIIQILNSSKQKILLQPEDWLKEILKNPINSPSLKNLLIQKKAEKVLIIVNDITRPTPYDVILPPLLEELHHIGIKKENIIFIIATGSHRGNSKEEIKEIFGEDIAGCYKFINHDDQKSQMKDFGQLKSGNRLLVNSLVSEMDFVITTGVIVPHYFAGFSGGRKSILPGICGRKTIEANHANMVHPDARAGNLKGNPVHEEMQEGAEKVGVDFNINVVTDENHQIIKIVAGELYASWLKGVEVCKKTYLCPIKHKAEVVITSPGGYPQGYQCLSSPKGSGECLSSS